MKKLLVSAVIGLLGWIGVTTTAWSQDRALSPAQPPMPVSPAVSASAPAADDAALIALGRRVYREGLGVDGQPLVAVRGGGLQASGAAVACLNCHRSSGLGAVEGNIAVSPITGRYLFGQDGRAVVQQNIRGVKAFNQHHAPYDERSVAAAIRAGVHVSGRALDPLMPRFRIDDASLQALLAYLRPLSSGVAPGVADKQIRLASVITPDVEPARRQLFIDTVRAAVRQKNGSVVHHGQRAMSSAAEMLLRTARNWEHEVWELHGPEETWAAQLQAHQERAPVFALVSGLGASRWAPVHRFCEQQAMPCWFPSVAQPPVEAESDNYSVYFSRGLWLEADVLAQRWQQAGAQAPRRVLQVLGDAADAPVLDSLEAAMAGGAMTFERQAFDAARAPALLQRLRALGGRDAVLLWLRPAQVEALVAALSGAERSSVRQDGAALIWSGQLLAGQAPNLPPAWLAASEVVYPYQLPDRRGASLSYFRQWLQIARLPLADEVLQSEVYFALAFLNDVLVDMLDNVQRDYLLDRAEAMLTLRETARAEDEAREQSTVAVNRGPRAGLRGVLVERNVATRPLPGRRPIAQPAEPETRAEPAPELPRSEGTTVYPRLSLAPGQRHASRGAYLLRYRPAAAPGQAPQAEAQSDWITP